MKKVILLSVIFIFSFSFVFGEKITFSASSMSGQAGNTNTTTMLKGNAYIKTETMEINADEVELSGEDFRYIKATGKVEGKNLETKMDFSCESLEYDRELKTAVLKGGVVFKDVENDVEANAEVIEYNQETEIVILQINVKLIQEDNVCTGSYGIYYKENQLLELSGNAQVQQKDDTFRAQHITLNLDTQEITLGVNVKGSVTDTKTVEKEGEAPAEEEQEEQADAEGDSKEEPAENQLTAGENEEKETEQKAPVEDEKLENKEE